MNDAMQCRKFVFRVQKEFDDVEVINLISQVMKSYPELSIREIKSIRAWFLNAYEILGEG